MLFNSLATACHFCLGMEMPTFQGKSQFGEEKRIHLATCTWLASLDSFFTRGAPSGHCKKLCERFGLLERSVGVQYRLCPNNNELRTHVEFSELQFFFHPLRTLSLCCRIMHYCNVRSRVQKFPA